MKGYVLLADGMMLEGELRGAPVQATGWLAANTSVVGFQEMVTDPAYAGLAMAFTYPEVGAVGVAAPFNESSRVQVSALLVKVLCEYRSHYLSEDSLENMLLKARVPCLTGVDTRALAVHIRKKGEMPAAVAPAGTDPNQLRAELVAAGRPSFQPPQHHPVAQGSAGPKVAVLDLGIRRSLLSQLALCCRPVLLPPEAEPSQVLEERPAGVLVSDGPCACLPPEKLVRTVRALVGKVPILACGLGHLALGMALGCKTTFLKRGHHGANYPVRNLNTGRPEVTQQRHSAVLDRASVEAADGVQLLMENMNDGSVEAIQTPDGSAVGYQHILAAPEPGAVNAQLAAFVQSLRG